MDQATAREPRSGGGALSTKGTLSS
jgi:hypothetical protein